MVEHNLVVHETENGVCVVLWQLSETTASVDDGDLAAADQFTCNALDYKLLFTLNTQTAMLNISILTEGKQCQKFNLLLTFVENQLKSTSLSTDGSLVCLFLWRSDPSDGF